VSNWTARQFDTLIGQSSLELEVACCVGGVVAATRGEW
jgi:hypothetical protein